MIFMYNNIEYTGVEHTGISQVLNESAKEDLTTIVSVPVISIKGSNGRVFSTPRSK